jgi:hypothetical protein
VLQIVFGQKVGKEFAIFENRIYRFAEKSSIATERPHGGPVRMAVLSNLKISYGENSKLHLDGSYIASCW